MPQRKQKNADNEPDGVYFLKLVLYIIMGSLWVKFSDGATYQLPLPVGLVIGLLFSSHEHFRIDRKIEFAVLLIAALVGFWAPYGIYVML